MRTFPVNPTLKWRPLQSLQMLCKGWQKLCSHVFFYWRIYECWSLSLQKLFEYDKHRGLVVYFVSEKTHKSVCKESFATTRWVFLKELL